MVLINITRYAYYSIDLRRNINSLDREAMKILAETIKANDGTKGTYHLVEHTSDAVRIHERGAKTRLRYFLRQIEKAFWTPEEVSAKNSSRLMKRFAEWNESDERIERERKDSRNYTARFRGGWLPYLRYDFGKDLLMLKLPGRLIRSEEEPEAFWEVCCRDQKEQVNTDTVAAVTGFMTEEKTLLLGLEDLFEEYRITLYSDGKPDHKPRKIRKDWIRFFEADGDMVEAGMLRPGVIISFSAENQVPESEARLDIRKWNGLAQCTFQFEEGDLVFFPDGTAVSVGKKPEEGLLKRGLQKGVYGEQEGKRIPVYAETPSVFARILPQSMDGTQLRVNETRYRLFENGVPLEGVVPFELQEATREKGVHISLSHFGVRKNGLYHVELDIPNDHANRTWDLMLIEGLEYTFEEAPYIFVERGVLCVPEKTGLKAFDHGMKPETADGQSRFAFEIPEEDDCFRLSMEGIPVAFEIPKLSYRFDREEGWRTKMQHSVWHSELSDWVYIRYPADQITLMLDEAGGGDDDDEGDAGDDDRHPQKYRKNQEKGYFECNLHPFKSWYGDRLAVRRLYLMLPGMEKPARFLNVYLKNVLYSATLKYDQDQEEILGEFDIIGKADNYADLWYGEQKLLEKEPVKDGKISLKANIQSGQYRVDVYQSEEDDDGFGDPDYEFLGSKVMELLNPANLTGRHIEVSQLLRRDEEGTSLRLKQSYTLYDLKQIEGRKKGNYSGHLVVRDKEHGKYRDDYPACVKIPDPNELSKGFLYELNKYGETDGLIYDNDRSLIRRNEDPNIREVKGAARYRRFDYLSGDMYLYRIGFVEKPEDLDSRLEAERAERKLELQGREQSGELREYKRKLDPLCRPLRDTGLSIAIRNELAAAGIVYTTDLRNMTMMELSKIKGLNRSDIEQCIAALRRAGYKISMF